MILSLIVVSALTVLTVLTFRFALSLDRWEGRMKSPNGRRSDRPISACWMWEAIIPYGIWGVLCAGLMGIRSYGYLPLLVLWSMLHGWLFLIYWMAHRRYR